METVTVISSISETGHFFILSEVIWILVWLPEISAIPGPAAVQSQRNTQRPTLVIN